MQPVQRAGKYSTDTKHEKTGNNCQGPENMQSVVSAEIVRFASYNQSRLILFRF